MSNPCHDQSAVQVGALLPRTANEKGSEARHEIPLASNSPKQLLTHCGCWNSRMIFKVQLPIHFCRWNESKYIQQALPSQYFESQWYTIFASLQPFYFFATSLYRISFQVLIISSDWPVVFPSYHVMDSRLQIHRLRRFILVHNSIPLFRKNS